MFKVSVIILASVAVCGMLYPRTALANLKLGYVPRVGSNQGSSNYSSMSDLLADLLDPGKYDKQLRPVLFASTAVKVRSSFYPMMIVDFDTSEQSMLVNGYFVISWTDQLLTWDAGNYSGTDGIRLPLNDIWYPEIVLQKTLKSNVIGNVSMDVAAIDYNGSVVWVPNGVYSFLCDVDVTYYPFDTQACAMSYYVTDQIADDVALEPGSVHLVEYAENAEWSLQEVTSQLQEEHGTNVVTVTFTINRRSEFSVYTMVLPLATLSAISIFSFLVPIETGEKSGLSVTIFLAFAFFIFITRDALPHNSVQTSYYVIYLTGALVVSVVNLVYVMVESRIHYSVGKERCRLLTTMPYRNRKKVGVLRVKKATREANMPSYESITWSEMLRKLDTALFCLSLCVMILFSILLVSRLQSRSLV